MIRTSNNTANVLSNALALENDTAGLGDTHYLRPNPIRVKVSNVLFVKRDVAFIQRSCKKHA